MYTHIHTYMNITQTYLHMYIHIQPIEARNHQNTSLNLLSPPTIISHTPLFQLIKPTTNTTTTTTVH
jgi:hypothetical protein